MGMIQGAQNSCQGPLSGAQESYRTCGTVMLRCGSSRMVLLRFCWCVAAPKRLWQQRYGIIDDDNEEEFDGEHHMQPEAHLAPLYPALRHHLSPFSIQGPQLWG